ncbi:MAG: hypothetical protein V2A34_09085 [Lentisphaerota bacterium]
MILRVAGYLGGLIGIILFTLGRQSGQPTSLQVTVGAILLLAGFVSFLGSYILFALLQMRRRAQRTLKPPAP